MLHENKNAVIYGGGRLHEWVYDLASCVGAPRCRGCNGR